MDAGEAKGQVCLALLGAGIFARDAYAGIMKSLQAEIRLRYIWSRSMEAAHKLAEEVKGWAPDAEAQWGEEGLSKILSSPEVHCCAIVLPIQVQAEMAVRALTAGKHVLQEKPIGANLAQGLATRAAWADLANERGWAPHWAVAENFRFEPALHEARRIVATLGEMVVVQVAVEVPMSPRSKYFSCEWRRDPQLEGAFITDCGVHFVAALRLITGQEVVSVVGLCSHRDKSVPPPDTLAAALTLGNGCTGTLLISYSSPVSKMTWRVVCSKGVVDVERGASEGQFGFTVVATPREGASSRSFFPFAGVEEELRAFVADITVDAKGATTHTPDWRGSPVEALRDLAVVEAALQSGRHNEGVLQVEHVAD